MVAWILRFLFNKFGKKPATMGELTEPEVSRAEKFMLKMVQEESFVGLKDHTLSKLKPSLGPDGLIRLRTKIWARKDSEEFRSPIILPGGHDMVKKLVLEVHKRNGHVMGQNLLSILRENFWIIRGRQSIKKILVSCTVCQRYLAKQFEVESPQLPERRVRLKAELQRRFRIEYLGQLNASPGGFKNRRCPKVGEVVLIYTDQKKRVDWPLGIVEELGWSRDGKCRSVKLRTATGLLIRAVQHVFPLEIDSSNIPVDSGPVESACTAEEDMQEVPSTTTGTASQENSCQPNVTQKRRGQVKCVVKPCETRCGRKVNIPVKFRD